MKWDWPRLDWWLIWLMDLTKCVLHIEHSSNAAGVYPLRIWLVPLLLRHQVYPIVLQQLLRRHQRKAPLRHQEAERALVHRAIAVRVIKQRSSTRQMARERERSRDRDATPECPRENTVLLSDFKRATKTPQKIMRDHFKKNYKHLRPHPKPPTLPISRR